MSFTAVFACKTLFGNESRVKGIKVFAVEPVENVLKAFAESLIMDDFSFPKEFYRVAHVRVVAEKKNIVVSLAGFLLRSHILVKVGYRVAGGLEGGGGKGIAGGVNGVNACGVVNEIWGEAASFYFLHGKIPRKLMYYGGYHLHMPELLGADVRERGFDFVVGHCVAL